MSRDANQIAREQERREERVRLHEDAPARPIVRGTLSVWRTLGHMHEGRDPWIQSAHVHLDLNKPNMVIAYDERGDAEIFIPEPGMYLNFVPDREGE